MRLNPWPWIGFLVLAILPASGCTRIPLCLGHERFIIPREIEQIHRLRSYIASDSFSPDSLRTSQRARIDSIFFTALRISEGSTLAALRIAAFATIPYYTFPAIIPLVRWVIWIPVTTESREEFEKRFRNLPTDFLSDSSPGNDRDKLPHFFGSAFITCSTRDPVYAEMAGRIIEWLELAFKLEGSMDPRDIEVNAMGAEFGMALMQGRKMSPSCFLQ
ncbi:MAG: hypothetical protein GXO82_10700 [Chlorobi bacterium]|nr:hypothetical protein [Chlorobiota bacterium]